MFLPPWNSMGYKTETSILPKVVCMACGTLLKRVQKRLISQIGCLDSEYVEEEN